MSLTQASLAPAFMAQASLVQASKAQASMAQASLVQATRVKCFVCTEPSSLPLLRCCSIVIGLRISDVLQLCIFKAFD